MQYNSRCTVLRKVSRVSFHRNKKRKVVTRTCGAAFVPLIGEIDAVALAAEPLGLGVARLHERLSVADQRRRQVIASIRRIVGCARRERLRAARQRRVEVLVYPLDTIPIVNRRCNHYLIC